MQPSFEKDLALRVTCQGDLSGLDALDNISVNSKISSIEYKGICLDSRSIKPGDIFFALSGAKDGHDFISDAFSKGAVAAVGERSDTNFSGPYIQVSNVLAAFQALSKHHRMSWKGKVVGLSGSNGKTTLKGFISQLLEREFRLLTSPGNWNNHLGVPLTLFQLQPCHECLILEMGMNHQGELTRLVKLSEPDILCLSNIGTAHIGELGSFENIVKAKAELFRASQKNAILVVNQDQKEIVDISNALERRKVYFSTLNQNAEVFCELVENELKVKYGNALFSSKWTIPGKHNVQNICAAMGVCKALGVSAKVMKMSLHSVSLPSMRLEQASFLGDIEVIADCYNANPDSTASALHFLMDVKNVSEKRGAILGDMKELGKFSEDEHKKIGKLCVEVGLDFLITVGSEAKHIYDAALSLGFSKENIDHHEDVGALMNVLEFQDLKNTTILLKASRSMRFEKILLKLKNAKEMIR